MKDTGKGILHFDRVLNIWTFGLRKLSFCGKQSVVRFTENHLTLRLGTSSFCNKVEYFSLENNYLHEQEMILLLSISNIASPIASKLCRNEPFSSREIRRFRSERRLELIYFPRDLIRSVCPPQGNTDVPPSLPQLPHPPNCSSQLWYSKLRAGQRGRGALTERQIQVVHLGIQN